MQLIKVENYQQLSEKAANFVVETINENKEPVLGLATGATPIKLYENLIEKYRNKEVTFINTTTFNLDEYVGLSPNNVNSYRYYMDNNLFNHIDIKQENTHIPNGLVSDLQLECVNYENSIHEAGKIDLLILGLGLNGHIGFNEPGASFEARTHVVKLDDVTKKTNARFFNSIEDVPEKAITMGIKTIMDAKKILLLVNGKQKSKILQKVIYGNITENIPATILQKHPDVTIITDIEL